MKLRDFLIGSFSILVASTLTHPLRSQSSGVCFEMSFAKYLMGTRFDLIIRHPDIDAGKQAAYNAFQEIERVEGLLSSQKDSSEISAVNRRAGSQPVKVSSETYAIIQRGIYYAQRSKGLFDISIGPLSELWGFNSNRRFSLPSDAPVESTRELVNYRWIVLNESDTTVFLNHTGMQIDLGGMAKGYAVDRAVAMLKQSGISHFLLNAGGDIYVSGEKEYGEEWSIGIKNPRALEKLVAKLRLSDCAIATSGDYERFVVINGRRYHHILDPRTGYPAMECRSVTTISKSAEEADALATFLFVQGTHYLNSEDCRNIPYFIVDKNGQFFYNPPFANSTGIQLSKQ